MAQELTSKQKKVMEHVRERVSIEGNATIRMPLEAFWDRCSEAYEGLPELPGAVLSRMEYARLTGNDPYSELRENRILPAVQRAVSLILSGNPQVVPIPASADRNDRQSATFAGAVWEEYAERTNQVEKNRRAVLLAAVTGTAVFQTCWNPKAGPKTSTGGGEFSYEGEVDVQVLSPWEFWLDPFADSIDSAQWAATRRLVGLERLESLYPDLKKELQAVALTSSEISTRRTRAFSGSGMNFESIGMEGRADGPKCVQVIDFWSRPSPKFPKGLRVYCAMHGNTSVLLHRESVDNPYVGLHPDGWMELPFDIVSWAPVVGHIWSIGLVGPVMSIQRALNKSSQDIEHVRHLYAHPRPRVSEGSRYAKGLPQNVDEPLVMGPNDAVDYLTPAPINEYVFRHHDNLLEAFGTMIAQSDASQAKAPGEVRTGIAIELLQEKDESVYGPIRERFLRSLSNVAKRYLAFAQAYYTTTRKITTVGVNKAVSVRSFDRADLAGAADLRYMIDTGYGMSRAARRSRIMEDVQMGLLNPMDPMHIREIGKALGTHYYDFLSADFQADWQKAEDIITAIGEPGTEPPSLELDPFADLAVHYSVMRAFTQRPEFLEWEPDQQNTLREYLMQVALAMQEQAMAEAEMNPGDPAEAAGGSKPKEKGQGSPAKPAKTPGQITEAKQQGGMQ